MERIRALRDAGEELTLDHPELANFKAEYEEQGRLLDENLKKYEEKTGKVWTGPFTEDKRLRALYEQQTKDAEKVMEQQSRIKIDIK